MKAHNTIAPSGIDLYTDQNCCLKKSPEIDPIFQFSMGLLLYWNLTIRSANRAKSVVIADLKHHLADVEIEGRNLNKADVKITICDKLNQPYYIIEKYNVSYEGFMTSDYRARGELIATKTYHKIPRYKAS